MTTDRTLAKKLKEYFEEVVAMGVVIGAFLLPLAVATINLIAGFVTLVGVLSFMVGFDAGTHINEKSKLIAQFESTQEQNSP